MGVIRVVDVSDDEVQVTREQRRRTQAAIASGRPLRAAPEEQVRARRRYLERNWAGLVDAFDREGNVGSDDTLWSSFLPRGARCARAVGRVCWADEPAESRAIGTGFLVAPAVLLTNHHVLADVETASRCVVELDYEYDEEGHESPAVVHRLEPDRLFLTSQELDYAMVAVAADGNGRSPGELRGHLPLVEQTGKVHNGESLNLVHHPGGERKKVTIRESRLLAVDAHNLSYSGDTLGGSSGAPVLNDQWEVVALHFGGKPRQDEQGRPLTLTGELWDPRMGGELREYEFNVGTRASRVVADVRAHQPTSSEARDLVATVLGM